MSGVTTLVAACAAVLAGLLVAVVVRKAVRDVTEARTAKRRAALREAPDAAALAPLVLGLALGGRWERADLLGALSAADAAGRARAALAARAVGADLDPALRRAAASRRPETRGWAALTSALLLRPDTVALARPLLADRDGDVRLAACAALARFGTPAAADALLDALGDGRVPAARLVERLAGRWAVPETLARLEALPPGGPTAGALRALGLARAPEAAAAVAGHLRAEDLEERLSAVRALGELRAAEHAPAVVPLLEDERWEVRAQAAKALGALGDAGAVPGLEAALGDRAWWVRTNAAEALGRLGAPGTAALRRAAVGEDRYAAERARERLAFVAGQRASDGELLRRRALHRQGAAA